MKKLNLVIGLLALCSTLLAQTAPTETPKPKTANEKLPSAVLINLNLGYQIPGADMADRFNNNFVAGGSVAYLTAKNWMFSLDFDYIFADRLKEDVLNPLRNSQGYLINEYGEPGDVVMQQRGFYTGLRAGKLISIGKLNKRSAIEVSFGAGYMRHWVHLEDRNELLPQLEGDYIKGYNRMTAGLGLRQYIGYRLMTRNRLVNFFAGVDFTQGFTKSLRSWDFDLMSGNTSLRLDLLFGFRAGWTLPLYIYTAKTETRFYY